METYQVSGIADHNMAAPRDTSERSCGSDWRLERLIGRLPQRLRGATCALLRPSNRWVRIPAGVLLIAGGLLGFLPILGLWMLPLGLALLAEDVSPLRALRSWILDWVERRHPEWLDARQRSQENS